MSERWIGKSVKRVEDFRLLTGRGTYIDDHPPVARIHHAAIVRSRHAHGRILGYDVSKALAAEGVVAVITGADVAKETKPFAVGVTAPVHYYCAATDKVRFVGEPVAVVVARDRYLAEDAAELVEVEIEPLPAVVDVEKALEPGAPVLHEKVGTNLAGHRRLVYGDPDRAFREADVVLRERFRFPKYGSTPIETYGIIARWEPDGVCTVWSNFMGPFIMHPLTARVLGLAENRLRFIVPPDIGGSFGIKSSIYPYIALIALAAKHAGVPVKWIEDRREHLLASSSGTDRVAYREVAAKNDGTVLGMRYRWLDNVGGYIRSPEPGCSFRPTGNFVGPYTFQHLEVDASVVMTNKSLTGPNRGYACGHLYFETEGMMDRLAARLGLDPVEIRRRNLLQPAQFPYRTPTGGYYDSGDYPAALDKAVAIAKYDELRREQAKARAEGRWVGIGVALAVDPSVSNMGYVATALDPQFRAKPEYLPKSGAVDSATVKVDPLGRVTAILGTTPQGQGHQTIVAQIVADELGLAPDDVTVVDEMDTFTRVWSISSGTYSSRFGSVGTSAVALAARKLRAKLVDYAAHLMDRPAAEVEFRDGAVRPRAGKGPSYSVKDLAGRAHWNTESLPEGMEPGLQATAVFGFSVARAVDAEDRVNSSNTYGFIAEVMAVEVDRQTAAIKILKYVSVHDAGTIINPMIAEGQIYGGALHGLGGALYEELKYDDDGQLLTGTFMDYLVPTATEAPAEIEIAHVVSPSPLTPLGSKGLGESSSMTVPAVIANAVSDALAPLGLRITELPMAPSSLWELIQESPDDVKPAKFEYHAPSTLDEAVALLVRYGGDAKVLAGGQSLVPLLNFRLARPAALVDLNRITSLAYIREEGGQVRFGAMTRQRTIEFSPVVARRLPLLSLATRWVGHLPIRSRGTIGGSIAHADPSAEYPAVLTALGGEVVARGPKGERTLGPAELFETYLTTTLAPDEVLTEVRLPAMPDGAGAAFEEFARRHGDFAIVGVAAAVWRDGGRVTARLATAGAGPVPRRLAACEEILARDGLGDAAIEAAARRASELVEPDSDLHASADYRRHLAGVLTGRALKRAREAARA